MQRGLGVVNGHWIQVKDGNHNAFDIFSRHYSFYHYTDNRRSNINYPQRRLICGPGEKMVLLGQDGKSLFVWRKFIDKSGQSGVNCAVFRNEGKELSSDLIIQAEQLAIDKWGLPIRFYTYVNQIAVKSSNPGYCYKVAGWGECGRTKTRGLVILSKSMDISTNCLSPV